MFQNLGDSEALNKIREENKNKFHCAFLKRDPNACESLPSGFKDVAAGSVCPHNIYHHKPELFANREAVFDTLERIFRLVNAAEIGLLSESSLDPLTTTELIVAKNELNRQDAERTKNEHEQRMEAQVNQSGRPAPGRLR